MDPLTAFALFMLGQAVIPDAYSRGVDWVLHRGNAERLAKAVKDATGHGTGRHYRRWYEREDTWNLLVAQGPASYDELVASLYIELRKRRWNKPTRATVEELVKWTIGLFVSSLEPSEAVAVEGNRSARRDEVHDAAEIERHDRSFDALVGIAQRLDAPVDVAERAAYLPPAARQLLVDAPDVALAQRLLDLVDVDDPRAAVAALVRPIPGWLSGASPALLLAAAELALAYKVEPAIHDLYELAASLGIERGYCTARLALHHEVGQEEPALALLNALPPPRGIHADAAAAVLRQDRPAFDELAPADVAAADPLLAPLRLHHLRVTDASVEDTIAFLTDTVDRQPESPGLLMALAELHHQRSSQPTAMSRAADRARARDLLIEARTLRRRWRGDSAEAVAAACRLALAQGDPHRAITLGSAPPIGEATPDEAADSEVRHAVALAHAWLGNLADAADTVGPAADDHVSAMLRADVLSRSNADPSVVADAYATAAQLADTDLDLERAWLGGAAAGLDPLPRADELANRAPDFQALVAAQAALAAGRPADAVAVLRPYPNDELHVGMLAAALAADGDVDEAVALLRSAADRFNDPAQHLTDAVKILHRYEHNAEAAELAAVALQVVPSVETDARNYLHQTGIADAWNEGAWLEAARLIRAWISDMGAAPHRRWALAQTLNNGHDTAGAWAAIRHAPALEPTDAGQAQLWIILAAQEAPGPETVKRMVELVDLYPQHPEVAQTFVGWFLLMGDDERGDVDDIVVARFQQLLEEHAVDHDGGPRMSAPLVRITGTPEEMLEQMRSHLEGRARLIDDMTERVRGGYPYGMVNMVAGRTYLSALIQRAAGFLPIATVDDDRAAAERQAARDALSSRTAVIDVSTLALSYYLRTTWPDLRDRFRLEITSPAKYDILRGEDELTDGRLGMSVYFDTAADAMRVSETEPEALARIAEHARWVAAQVPHLTTRDWPRITGHKRPAAAGGEDGDGDGDGEAADRDGGLLPWMSSYDMAKARGFVLWADDLGLRTLARNEGVPSFGTVALLEVLHEDGHVSDPQLLTVMRTLRQEYAVDLPLDRAWLLMSAASDAWEPGPACAYFQRRITWFDFPSAIDAWELLAEGAADDEPAKVVPWVVHAAHGLVQAAVAGMEHRLVALVVSKGIVYSGFEPPVMATLLRVGREVCAKYGHPNPVPLVLSTLHSTLSQALGTSVAAQYLVTQGAELAEVDADVLRTVVLGGPAARNAPPAT